MVDISSFDAIMYIQYKERSRHMVSRLSTSISRGFKASLIIISTSLWLQGCSSLSTGGQDGFHDLVFKGWSSDPTKRPWDPPTGVGYGARIPNMEGDWDRFCATEEEQIRNGCIR